jgi:hypothetical protein
MNDTSNTYQLKRGERSNIYMTHVCTLLQSIKFFLKKVRREGERFHHL